MPNDTIREATAENGTRVRLVRGDITREQVDAIVNAANTRLKHGGGVALAIARAGGPAIQHESDAVAPVRVGEAAVTGAGALPCRLVIHAVGPRYGEGDEERKLSDAIRASLAAAAERGLASISLPAISSGIYGYPKDECAEIHLDTVDEYLEDQPDTSLREIRFCLYDVPTVEAFEEAWEARHDA